MCTCVLRPVTYLFSVALRKLCGDAPNVVTQINALQYQVCIRKKKLLGCQHATKVKIYIYIYIYIYKWMNAKKTVWDRQFRFRVFVTKNNWIDTYFPQNFPSYQFHLTKKNLFCSFVPVYIRGVNICQVLHDERIDLWTFPQIDGLSWQGVNCKALKNFQLLFGWTFQ